MEEDAKVIQEKPVLIESKKAQWGEKGALFCRSSNLPVHAKITI